MWRLGAVFSPADSAELLAHPLKMDVDMNKAQQAIGNFLTGFIRSLIKSLS